MSKGKHQRRSLGVRATGRGWKSLSPGLDTAMKFEQHIVICLWCVLHFGLAPVSCLVGRSTDRDKQMLRMATSLDRIAYCFV